MRELLWVEAQTLLKNRKEKLKFLHVACVIYEHVIQAVVEFYIHHRYESFDPHVGDNLCQVRACELALLARRSSKNHELILSFLDTKKNIFTVFSWFQDLLNKSSTKSLFLDKPVTILEFLTEINLNFKLSKDILFIYQCFFLTKYRKYTNDFQKTYIDYKDASKKLSLSKTLVDTICFSIQKKLCIRTSQFVQKNLPSTFLNSAPLKFQEYLKQDRRGRVIPPFFFSTLAVLTMIQKEKLTSLISVRDLKNEEAWECALSGKNSIKEENFCIIWHGSTTYSGMKKKKWLEEFQSLGPWKVILAVVAQHPQYVDSMKIENELLFGFDYRQSLALAKKLNLSEPHLSFLSISHVTFNKKEHRIGEKNEGLGIEQEVACP